MWRLGEQRTVLAWALVREAEEALAGHKLQLQERDEVFSWLISGVAGNVH